MRFLSIVLLIASLPASGAMQRLALIDSLAVANVWSGHPVDFAFVARGDSQYIAYYDSARRMTVALRDGRFNTLRRKNLSSTLGWDSHNYIAMALDGAGNIHVSGNMHSSGLVYFRSTAPGNIDSLKSAGMVGTEEGSVTYPVFYRGPSGELVFMYRTGESGNGNQIFNKWTITTKKWARLFDQPLFDGQGQRNAYMGGPLSGPDGYYYVYWMWRETADAATTHDVGCIRSKDLIAWETVGGKKLTLPVTLSTQGVLVETIAQHGGVINRGAIGFDALKRPIVTYHKFDAKGFTQLYDARWEGSAWNIRQVTDWAYRWDFGGTGTLVLQITFGPVELTASGSLIQSYYHVKNGTGIMLLNDTTLKQQAGLGSSQWPESLEKAQRSGMVVHWLKSEGVISLAGSYFNSTSTPNKDPTVVHALRWETMPESQDQARSPIPAPTPLMLYTFKDPNVETPVPTGGANGHAPGTEPAITFRAGRILIRPVLPQQGEADGASVRIVDARGKIALKYLIRNIGNRPVIEPDAGTLRSGFYLVVLQEGKNTRRKGIILGESGCVFP